MTRSLATLASGSGLLLIDPTDPRIALWGMLITTVGGVLKAEFDRRGSRKEAAQKHQFEMDERAALRREIAENTELTKAGCAEASRAYETANHVNEKIAALGVKTASGSAVPTIHPPHKHSK